MLTSKRKTVDGKMLCRWDSPKDLHDRLGSTILLYKGVPFLVEVSNTTLHLHDLVTMNQVHTVRYNDPELDVGSPELGYFNDFHTGTNEVGYVIRVPYKRYKQGIHSYNVKFEGVDGEEIGQNNRRGQFRLYTDGFRDSLMDIFPEPDEALAKISSGECRDVAVSQSVALRGMSAGVVMVYFRTKDVGWINPMSGSVMVPQNNLGWIVKKNLEGLGWNIEFQQEAA